MTTEAVTTMPFQRPTRHYIQPEEVRLPCTPEEADAALELCDLSIDSLEECIAHLKATGSPSGGAVAKLRKWEVRRAEVQYTATRMDAGLPAIDPAIVDRYNSTLAQLVSARTRITELEKQLRERPAPTPEARVRGLIAEVAHLTACRKADAEKFKNERVRHIHDAWMLARAAVQSMIAAGTQVTPLAAFVLNRTLRDLPAGFAEEWMAKALPPVRAAAIEHASANGATCAEPDSSEVR